MSEWIKFSERKPERGQLIVTANDYGAQWVEKYSGSEYPGYYWISISRPPKRTKFDEHWESLKIADNGYVNAYREIMCLDSGRVYASKDSGYYNIYKAGFIAGQQAGKDEEWQENKQFAPPIT